MKYKLICNGDSWVFGCEIVDPLLVAKHPPELYVGEYDFTEENIDYRTERIWTTYIKEYLDCDTVNLSWPADDNKTILNRTIDYVIQEYITPGKSTEELVVIVGWTSPERNSWWWHDDKMPHNFRIWPHVEFFNNPEQKEFWKIYIKYLWNPEEYMTRYIMDNLTLQNFCIANNIKYLTYSSFYQIKQEHVSLWNKDFTEAIDQMYNTYYPIDDDISKTRGVKSFDWKKTWNLIKSPNYYMKDKEVCTFNQFIQKNLKDPYVGLHPNPEAHRIWAKEIARYLKSNILKNRQVI
tara:strand:- start:1682 stop:2560 length:879 start_codon:yes stop_codon:yes gene_type:complete